MNKKLILSATAIIATGMVMAQSNYADVDQWGAGTNSSTVDQVGYSNYANVDQNNTSSATLANVSDVDQDGDDNNAYVSQVGGNNDSWIDQDGDYNTSGVWSHGQDNDVIVKQVGASNTA